MSRTHSPSCDDQTYQPSSPIEPEDPYKSQHKYWEAEEERARKKARRHSITPTLSPAKEILSSPAIGSLAGSRATAARGSAITSAFYASGAFLDSQTGDETFVDTLVGSRQPPLESGSGGDTMSVDDLSDPVKFNYEYGVIRNLQSLVDAANLELDTKNALIARFTVQLAEASQKLAHMEEDRHDLTKHLRVACRNFENEQERSIGLHGQVQGLELRLKMKEDELMRWEVAAGSAAQLAILLRPFIALG
ncbi:hypothetical protein C8F01DRAFT_1251748 [Mycena amicta]|nr:hypothetical protein C8F01DRAFT_1251748 [Mycena amicta]